MLLPQFVLLSKKRIFALREARAEGMLTLPEQKGGGEGGEMRQPLEN